jgi:hypothetical protein
MQSSRATICDGREAPSVSQGTDRFWRSVRRMVTLGGGQRPAGSPSAPRGQPERPAEAHTEEMVRAIAASRGAGSDQRPPRPAPEATSTRGQRPTTSGHRQRTLSATSAGKVICSPFSVEGVRRGRAWRNWAITTPHNAEPSRWRAVNGLEAQVS